MQHDNIESDTNIKLGTTVFSIAYLAPIDYFVLLTNTKSALLEAEEKYQKQTYRNRCRIATSKGVMDLCIPIEGGANLIRDVKISNHAKWQQQHWRTFETVYKSSPFYEYYVDDLSIFYEKNYLFLWDFNFELQNKIIELLDIQSNISITDKYVTDYQGTIFDARDLIHPKKHTICSTEKYYQVFESRIGFIPNLSIIDLLFNMGNEAAIVLKNNKVRI